MEKLYTLDPEELSVSTFFSWHLFLLFFMTEDAASTI